MTHAEKKGFSLSFGSKQSIKVRSGTTLRAETLARSDASQVTVENINSTTLFAKKQVIIPLIKNNVYATSTQILPSQSNDLTETSQTNSTTTTNPLSSTTNTIDNSEIANNPISSKIKGDHEIASEEDLSKKYGLIINKNIHDKKKTRQNFKNNYGLYATIKANRVPGLENEHNPNKKFQLDVMQRPDADDISSMATNSSIKIEQFGKAALLGMGWKDGQPIGRGYGTIKMEPVPTQEIKPRPRLLGLGANANLTTLSQHPNLINTKKPTPSQSSQPQSSSQSQSSSSSQSQSSSQPQSQSSSQPQSQSSSQSSTTNQQRKKKHKLSSEEDANNKRKRKRVAISNNCDDGETLIPSSKKQKRIQGD